MGDLFFLSGSFNPYGRKNLEELSSLSKDFSKVQDFSRKPGLLVFKMRSLSTASEAVLRNTTKVLMKVLVQMNLDFWQEIFGTHD